MTASIISDVNSLIMPTTQTNESANSGSGFEDIFNSVNQNYSQNDSSASRKNENAQNSKKISDTQNVERNISDEKKNEAKPKSNRVENSEKVETKETDEPKKVVSDSDEKVQPEKKAEDNSQKTDAVSSETTEVAPETKQEIVDLAKLQMPADAQLQAEATVQTEVQQPQNQAENTENTSTEENSSTVDNSGNVPETLPTQLKNANNAEEVLNLLIVKNQVQGETSGLNNALSNLSKNTAQGAVNGNYGLSQAAQNNQNNQNAQAPVSNQALQAQTQQAISNVQVEPASESVLPQGAVQVVSDVQIQATEDLASEAAANSAIGDKQVLKDTLNKSSLTQEMLEKTDAKVVSVQTQSSSSNQNSNSNSNSSNLLNQQNAQEQAVKLSLESSNSSLQGTADSLGQTVSFDKTLQSTQIQPQSQPQTAPELSKSDILSQIHTKLTNLQDEGSSKVTIILRPENLGKIHLELVNSKEGLTAQMTTDNAQVKELLDKSLDGLRETLSSQGVNVNNVSVKVSETQKQDTMFSFDGNSEQNKQNPQGHKNGGTEAFSSSDDEGNVLAEQGLENDSLAEGSDSTIMHDGKVDYKI